LADCRAKGGVSINRFIYQLLTTELNLLTVFWVPLIPKPKKAVKIPAVRHTHRHVFFLPLVRQRK
jgi:hypothetical protein